MRAYEESHPWITFKATDINSLGPKLWMLIGEARSKCEHLAGAPLHPSVAEEFYIVALVKGARATTAIEGNTLTEEQVAGILNETFSAPASRAYQEREVKNVLDSLKAIAQKVMDGERLQITGEFICELNRQILEGTEYDSHVEPGKVRQKPVAVGNYRGAPAEDCPYLLESLAQWLESDIFQSDDPEIQFALAVASAIYSHLYIAWIHPFGDGNGRTARLLEFLILARSGMVPLPAAHLLSDHYNLTRDQYYRELNKASAAKSTTGFLGYALQGFVDGIRYQIDRAREQQFTVTWINYAHATMRDLPASPALERQRSLLLAMPSGEVVSRGDLVGLTPQIAALYAKAGPRTLSRDLNKLRGLGLVLKHRHGWQSNDQSIRAFLPPMADNEGND